MIVCGKVLQKTMENAISVLTARANVLFLNKDGLCEVYRELGPDKMSETCKTYPRISWYHGDILFCGLTISCSEVARMVLSHSDSINFSFGEAETGVDSCPR